MKAGTHSAFIDFKIDRIYLDKDAKAFPLAGKILSRFSGVPVQEVDNADAFRGKTSGLSFGQAKRVLWLTCFRGNCIKPCPATSQPYLCCGYWIINQQTNCPMDCAYCVLQGYLNQPVLTVYLNTDEIHRAMAEMVSSHPKKLFRIGTGELTDSLALDPVTGWNAEFLSHCQDPRVIYEIKTKTAQVSHLPEAGSAHAVVSWSVNPEKVIQGLEFHAASLAERLRAMKIVLQKGYKIGLHFDPIVDFEEWEREYAGLIEDLGHTLEDSDLVWISLGTVRFPPPVKRAVTERFPKAGMIRSEMIRGDDGKWRYFRPLRTRLYKGIYAMIRARWKNVFVYFCMENKEVWESVMGYAPENNAHLDFLFHESLGRRFPEWGLCPADRLAYDDFHSSVMKKSAP